MIQIEKWHIVYRKLSELLNKIEEKSPETRGQQLYSKCFGDKEFRDNNEWIEKFYSKWKRKSLDPIHIFASINGNKLGHKKRIQRINILFRLLDSNFKEEYKEINFDGCPAPIILQMIGARNEDDQNEIWSIFGEVMTKSQKATIDFVQVKRWFGLDIRSFTIFLFWIDADNFLSLDKNTEAVLSKYGKIKVFPNSYKDYESLLTEKDTNLYRLLAHIAIDNSQLETMSQEDRSKVESYLTGKDIVVDAESSVIQITQNEVQVETTSKLDVSTDFRLIAIRPLKGCNPNYLKTLEEDVYYPFDKSYDITDTKIKKNKEKNISLFDVDNVDLNINAIVGKNGTGKSTIVELLFAFINNLAAIKKLNDDIKPIKNLKVEFIYEHEHIYKIIVDGGTCTCKRFDTKNEQFIEIKDFDIQSLFYTVTVNYSQHSLNNLIIGDWIHSLFHKNDSYKTPIVIEPYRKEGNIDINKQERFIKQRMLSNLLEQEDKDDIKNSPRQLTEFYRATHLDLTFNLEKIFYKTDVINKVAYKAIYKDDNNNIQINFGRLKNVYRELLSILYDQYNIHKRLKQNIYDAFDTYDFEDKVHLYVLKKLLSIAIRYEKYNKYFDVKNKKFKNIEAFIEEIYQDTSHITYKLKQAIYFLKFNEIMKIDENKQRYSLEDLSDEIHKIRMKKGNEQLTVNELVPPSFFDVDIILENDINFNTLSSGEKQKIYSVNSILYHLNNINSIDATQTKYKYINIVLDEIELYFHPELQRQYLSYLRYAISKANTNNISAINILFVTHSPFILSDIPDTKILFLDKKDEPNAKSLPADGVPTFGANIHELLINGFFMKNSIGEFALETINSIVEFHHKVVNVEEKDLDLLKKEYQKKKNEFSFIQEHIGEKYISKIVKNHIEEIEKTLNVDDLKKKKIEWLEQELKRLKEQEQHND